MKDITLAECRKAIYGQFMELKEGNISIDEALASSKMIHQAIQTFEVEVKAIEACNKSFQLGITSGIEGTTFISQPLIEE